MVSTETVPPIRRINVFSSGVFRDSSLKRSRRRLTTSLGFPQVGGKKLGFGAFEPFRSQQCFGEDFFALNYAPKKADREGGAAPSLYPGPRRMEPQRWPHPNPLDEHLHADQGFPHQNPLIFNLASEYHSLLPAQ